MKRSETLIYHLIFDIHFHKAERKYSEINILIMLFYIQ